MKKITFFFALGAACLFGAQQAKADNVDLSTLTADYVAQDGDWLRGTLAKSVKISIAPDATVNLENVSINADDAFSGDWAGITCEGNAEIILHENNIIHSFGANYAGIEAPSMGTLKFGVAMVSGYLTVKGGHSAAGIGASQYTSCQHIEFNGGTITAEGGNFGAGIGGASGRAHGNITFNGSTITAIGGTGCAGIGSGYNVPGENGHITFTAGTITANGGFNAAGIGSGEQSECLNITFTNFCKITAFGGRNAPAIGCGTDGKCHDITIGENCYILATAGMDCTVSVGKSNSGDCNSIVVDGENQGTSINETPWEHTPKKEGLENVLKDNVPCTKVMENGVPYIMYKGTKYNVQGAQVK